MLKKHFWNNDFLTQKGLSREIIIKSNHWTPQAELYIVYRRGIYFTSFTSRILDEIRSLIGAKCRILVHNKMPLSNLKISDYFRRYSQEQIAKWFFLLLYVKLMQNTFSPLQNRIFKFKIRHFNSMRLSSNLVVPLYDTKNMESQWRLSLCLSVCLLKWNFKWNFYERFWS